MLLGGQIEVSVYPSDKGFSYSQMMNYETMALKWTERPKSIHQSGQVIVQNIMRNACW
jgi:hypothetical protein